MDENLKTNRNRGELWQYDGAELVDLDRDGDLDLVLGQIRDTHPYHLNQHSIVLENEGTGDFGRRYLASLRIGVRRDLPQFSRQRQLFPISASGTPPARLLYTPSERAPV